jgi:hypothetical protein
MQAISWQVVPIQRQAGLARVYADRALDLDQTQLGSGVERPYLRAG